MTPPPSHAHTHTQFLGEAYSCTKAQHNDNGARYPPQKKHIYTQYAGINTKAASKYSRASFNLGSVPENKTLQL